MTTSRESLVSPARAAEMLDCNVALVHALIRRRVLHFVRQHDGSLKVPSHEIRALLRVPREDAA